MSEPVVLVEKSEGIATVTLNRPQAMNALSMELRDSLRQAFIDLGSDPEAEVVILTGAGRGFCGGLDLKELATKGIGIDDATAIPTGESFFTIAKRRSPSSPSMPVRSHSKPSSAMRLSSGMPSLYLPVSTPLARGLQIVVPSPISS